MNYPKKAFLYADVVRRVGIRNAAYVGWYRLSIKTGVRERFFPPKELKFDQDFFRPVTARADYPPNWRKALFHHSDRIIQGELRYYRFHWKAAGSPPDWFLNPFNGKRFTNPRQHWTRLKDFNPAVGDIKNVWEASRFEWVVTLACAHAVSGDVRYLNTLNQWLRDWTARNPLNLGPNWKCGQEAAIRVFNLLQAALILKQWNHPSKPLRDLVYYHLERIHGNIGYAMAQDNNHGTSEAAALFIGGRWLVQTNESPSQSGKINSYARQGRKWLENRIVKLVEKDGSFSQHSVTYHRVLLDTLVFVEHWRKTLGAALFSRVFYERVHAAIQWLCTLTDSQSGSAPNLGANDGSLLLNTHMCDYRDFRPSLQAGSVLFDKKTLFDSGPWDEPLYWFSLNYRQSQGEKSPRKTSTVLQGGYVMMAGRNSWALLRFPMYRFRPSHNDVFHFDLWLKGENICRDGGTYSYNPGSELDAFYFSSVKAHNTVCFDDYEQMPRLGRFMLGEWIKAEYLGAIEPQEGGGFCWRGIYRDYHGNRHQRTVGWQGDTWRIEDDLSRSFEKAEIRYRLIPGEYAIEGKKLIAPWGTMEIVADDCRMDMSKGFESLYYWEKRAVDILVVSVGRNCGKIVTQFVLD